MSKLKRSIVLFAFVCFVLNTTNAEERIAYKKHWDFPSGSELFFNPKFYRLTDEYHNLTYVLCDDYDDLDKSERNCTVVQDTQPERSCPVTLQTFNNGTHDTDYLEVYPLGSTRAVIVWPDYREPGSIKCTTLDFTSCESKDVVLEQTPYGYSHKIIDSTYFVAFGDSFEIVMPWIARSNSRYNRYLVAAEGSIISRMNPYLYKLWERSAPNRFRGIVEDSKLKGYLQCTRSSQVETFMIGLDRFYGGNKYLASIPTKTVNLQTMVESTAHETIGIAIPADHLVDVRLFDQQGNHKLNTSLPFDIKVEKAALRNLADGGFVLLTVGSKNVGNGPLHPDTYYLTKVDAGGKVVGTIRNGPEPNCQGKHLGLQVFENDAKEYCALIACSFAYEGLRKGLTSSEAQLDVVVKCFTDNDFAKSKTVV